MEPFDPAGDNVALFGIGFGKGRIESLTDGIFAFAMTLLVLGAGYPFTINSFAGMSVRQIYQNSLPDVLLYIISFLILAAFWVAHHSQFHYIKFVDRTFLWLNILTLMFIAFIPFTSYIAGIFPADTLAAIVFEVHLLITGMLFHLQWEYATRQHRLVEKSLPAAVIRRGGILSLIIPAISCGGIAIALFNIPYSILVYAIAPFLIWFRVKK